LTALAGPLRRRKAVGLGASPLYYSCRIFIVLLARLLLHIRKNRAVDVVHTCSRSCPSQGESNEGVQYCMHAIAVQVAYFLCLPCVKYCAHVRRRPSAKPRGQAQSAEFFDGSRRSDALVRCCELGLQCSSGPCAFEVVRARGDAA
jgi:hypothetical protein